MRKLVILILLAMIVLPNYLGAILIGNEVIAAKAQTGDVEIRVNGGAGEVYIGEVNTIEFWFENDVPIETFELQLIFDVGRYYYFVPAELNGGYVEEEGDMVSGLLLDAEIAEINHMTPDSIIFGATFMAGIYPVHTTHSLSHTMLLYIRPDQAELANGFGVSCVPDQGHWFFREDGGSNFTPTYNGQAPILSRPKSFDIVEVPPVFECGNVNCDGVVDISDAVYLVNFVFVPGAPAPCECP